jgi:hypothetical protein
MEVTGLPKELLRTATKRSLKMSEITMGANKSLQWRIRRHETPFRIEKNR